MMLAEYVAGVSVMVATMILASWHEWKLEWPQGSLGCARLQVDMASMLQDAHA